MQENKTIADRLDGAANEARHSTNAGFAERREHNRFEPSVKGAFIYVDARLPLLDCEVLNLSDGGAKLRAFAQIPTHFLLFFTQDGSQRRSCRVIWRDGNSFGVAFEDANQMQA